MEEVSNLIQSLSFFFYIQLFSFFPGKLKSTLWPVEGGSTLPFSLLFFSYTQFSFLLFLANWIHSWVEGWTKLGLFLSFPLYNFLSPFFLSVAFGRACCAWLQLAGPGDQWTGLCQCHNKYKPLTFLPLHGNEIWAKLSSVITNCPLPLSHIYIVSECDHSHRHNSIYNIF